jgi:transposase-like protein
MTKRQRNRDKMIAHIERWQASGLTYSAYCRKARINYNGFYYWVKKYKEENSQATEDVGFFPVTVQEHPTSETDRIIVVTPNGMEIIFPCTQQSIALIRELVMA